MTNLGWLGPTPLFAKVQTYLVEVQNLVGECPNVVGGSPDLVCTIYSNRQEKKPGRILTKKTTHLGLEPLRVETLYLVW